MSANNLGQVAGVHISDTPPINTVLIWYDTVQRVHKVYDVNLTQWVVLDKNTITLKTYEELVSTATSVGLSVGAWYKISNKSNALALAITTTKIQYTDLVGNVLIDDLGTNVQYHVTSSNLLIDDVAGVFDNVNKKLVFQFTEVAPDYALDDYILGKRKRDTVWSLAKYKIRTLLSTSVGNSITWNSGFFFNFGAAINAIKDETGGIVSKQSFDSTVQTLNTSLENVSLANQAIVEHAESYTDDAVTATEIYGKQLPINLTTTGAAIDIAKTDTLVTILSKIQRFINKFKLATGISISSGFAQAATEQWITNTDTVESAFGKVQYWYKSIVKKLAEGYAAANLVNGVSPVPAVDDTFPTAISKLHGKFKMEYEFDYVVDSDASLRALSGKAVSNVLIKYGNFSVTDLPGGIVLHSSVKRVVAEKGAIITVTNLNNVSSAGAIKGHSMCTLHNLKVSADRIAILGFKGVYDCETFQSGTLTNGGAIYGCENLFNVISHGGFQFCNYLSGCSSIPVDVNNDPGKGFASCNFLTNCTADAIIGFMDCYNLVNCRNLERVSVTAFYGCTCLTNCYGYVSHPASFLPQYPGAFALCKKVINCSAKIADSAVGYSSSYASWDTSAACADTAAGGFNSVVGYYRT